MAIVVTQSFLKHPTKRLILELGFDHCKLISSGQDVELCVSYLFEVCTCSLSVSALLDVGTGATVQLTNTVSCCQCSIVFLLLHQWKSSKTTLNRIVVCLLGIRSDSKQQATVMDVM